VNTIDLSLTVTFEQNTSAPWRSMATAIPEGNAVKTVADSDPSSEGHENVHIDSSVATAVDSVPRSANQQRTSYRMRTPTEKGISYSKQQLADRRNKSWKCVHNKIQEVLQLMKVSITVSDVEGECQEFNKLLAEYEGISAACRSLLNVDEIKEDESELKQSDRIVSDFKTELYGWLRAHQLTDVDSRSSVSARSHSNTSRCSRTSSASARAVEKMAKLAAFQEMKKFAVKEAELEQQRLKSE
jgi:hypothetical protein